MEIQNKFSHKILKTSLAIVVVLFSTNLLAAEDSCTKGFYAMINTELKQAYFEIGKPAVDFTNLGIVKDMAVSRLEQAPSKWPKGATYSISVLRDSISVTTFCGDKSTTEEWAPVGK